MESTNVNKFLETILVMGEILINGPPATFLAIKGYLRKCKREAVVTLQA